MKTKVTKQDTKILELTVKNHLLDPSSKMLLATTDQENPTIFVSNMPTYAAALKEQNKAIIFVGKTFLYGLQGSLDLFDPKTVQPIIDGLVKEASKSNDNGQK